MSENSDAQFPEAQVHEGGNVVAAIRRNSSRLWIVTVLCLIVTVVLFASANRNRGTHIAVRFQQGHGIKPGDVLRHRGIEVGEVTSVKLDYDLGKVIVDIVLEPTSAGLAREGSQFWIERPDVSLTGIRGLETIVGGRYLAVAPGDPDAELLTSFDGLETAPMTTERTEGGLEITLESIHRRGVRPGAPVLYRGHKVGQIVSVGLSPDASQVEARAYIEPAFKRLIRDNTVFWSTSGVKANFSLSSGFELSAETLETIAAGGVSLATPNSPGKAVSAGHRFTLLNKGDEGFEEDTWTKWQPHIAIGSIDLPDAMTLPQPVRAALVWKEKQLGFTRARQREGWLLALSDNRLLAPADLLLPPDGALDATASLQLAGQEVSISAERIDLHGKLATLRLEKPLKDIVAWPTDRLRKPSSIEEVFSLAESAEAGFPIPANRLTAARGVDEWDVAPSFSISPQLHGACVVSRADGTVLGLIVIDKGIARIAFAPL